VWSFSPTRRRCNRGRLPFSPIRFSGMTVMVPPLECRLRAAECQRMAAQAPNPRVQNILLDMARTWTRLALEAEEWTRINKPSMRLKKPAPKSPQADSITPIPFPSRGSRRELS
jgi:hypothetical protein